MATTTVLTRTARQGTHLSSTLAVPDDCEFVGCDLSMTDAQRSNEARTVRRVIEVSRDGASGWEPLITDEWQGGTTIEKGTGNVIHNPSLIEVGLPPEYRGWRVRVQLDVPTQFSVGATLTTSPN